MTISIDGRGWLLCLRRLANREICPIFTLHSQYMQYKDAIGNILGLDEIYFFPLTRIPLSLAFGQDKWFFSMHMHRSWNFCLAVRWKKWQSHLLIYYKKEKMALSSEAVTSFQNIVSWACQVEGQYSGLLFNSRSQILRINMCRFIL